MRYEKDQEIVCILSLETLNDIKSACQLAMDDELSISPLYINIKFKKLAGKIGDYLDFHHNRLDLTTLDEKGE